MDIPPGSTSRLRSAAPLRDASASFSDLHRLTTRERDVVFLLCSGVAQVSELAAALELRPNTVHNHLKGIFRRTRTRSKSELLAALLMHALERTEHCSQAYRRPQILLLDDCRAFADALAGLGMRVHEGEGESLGLGDDTRIDAVITPWRGAEHSSALRERLGASVPLLFASPDPRACEAAACGRALLPFDANHIAFQILVTLCDDPYARSRLLRVDANFAAMIDERLEGRVVNFGFGGAFVALPAEVLDGPSAPRCGEIVDVAMSIGKDRTVCTRADVVWTRTRARIALPSGIGLRFLGAADEGRTLLEGLVRGERLRALRASAASVRPAQV